MRCLRPYLMSASGFEDDCRQGGGVVGKKGNYIGQGIPDRISGIAAARRIACVTFMQSVISCHSVVPQCLPGHFA